MANKITSYSWWEGEYKRTAAALRLETLRREKAEEALASIRNLLGVDKAIEEAISELRGEIFNG